MPKTEEPDLGPNVERQLRSALDRVQPPPSLPRYQSEPARPWRFAPLALAAALTGVVALSAFAAAGEVSPAVVMNRISTAIQAEPEITPVPAPSENPKAAAPEHAATSAPQPKETSEPKETPEPSERPEPSDHASPPPGGDDHGDR
ncbi:MAG TPA: hypothetical protein VNA65_03140 [Candidatus Dormibacteraeota bacterium]|nr:hypothetical protein [Candidatus Dormibacteraeota bacterium]